MQVYRVVNGETVVVNVLKTGCKSGYLIRAGACLGVALLSACTSSGLLHSGPANLGPLDYVNWAREADVLAVEREQQRLQTLLDDGIATIPSLQFSILVGVRPEVSDATLADALAHTDFGVIACGLSNQCHSYMDFRIVWQDYLQQRQQLQATATSLQASQERVAELSQLLEGLRQQIEELTLIEQDIVEREQPLRQ